MVKYLKNSKKTPVKEADEEYVHSGEEQNDQEEQSVENDQDDQDENERNNNENDQDDQEIKWRWSDEWWSVTRWRNWRKWKWN